MSIVELQNLLASLQRLQDQVAGRIHATENALLMYGEQPVMHGPLRVDYQPAEMRAAHALHQQGIRSTWVDEGERAYQRSWARQRRSA